MKNKLYERFTKGDYIGFYQAIESFSPIVETEIFETKKHNYTTKKAYEESKGYGVADFETTPINETNKQGFSRVRIKELEETWGKLGDGRVLEELETIQHEVSPSECFISFWNEEELGNVYLKHDIYGFIHLLENLPYRQSFIDFHNLNFDGVFLMVGLNELGYQCLHDTFNEQTHQLNKIKVSKTGKTVIYDKCYTLSVRNGIYYELSIYLKENIQIKNKTYDFQKVIVIRDTFKITQNSLEKSVKAYTGIESPDKNGWDYSEVAKHGRTLTDLQKKYIKFDSLAYLCMSYEIRHTQGITNKSASGYAYQLYRESIRDEIRAITQNPKLIKTSKIDIFRNEERQIKKWLKSGKSDNQIRDMLYELLCPSFSEDVYSEIKNAYTGGHTYVNQTVLNQVGYYKKYGVVFDVNSLYPSVMSMIEELERLLGIDVYYPYGQPVLSKTSDFHNDSRYQNKTYPCAISEITVEFFKIRVVNNQELIPTLRTNKLTKYGIDSKTYLKESLTDDGKSFSIRCFKTAPEIDDIKKRYKCHITYHKSYLFKGSRNLFKDFVDEYYHHKQNAKGVKRQVAKLILNALYGKFGTNLKNTSQYPIYEEGKIRIVNVKNEYDLDYEYMDTEQSFNVAIASYITTYARLVLLTVVDKMLINGVSCVYQDTDSSHILFENKEELNKILDYLSEMNVLDKNNSGERMLWKMEGLFIDGVYIGAKKYSELINEEIKIEQILEIRNTHELEHYILQQGKRKYSCAGLSTKDNIRYLETFRLCENPKEIKTMFEQGLLYQNVKLNQGGKIVDPHLYYDKELTKPVVGAFLNKKKLTVLGGLVIEPKIFIITPHVRFF